MCWKHKNSDLQSSGWAIVWFYGHLLTSRFKKTIDVKHVNRSTRSSRHSMNLQSTNQINNSCHSNKTYAVCILIYFLDCIDSLWGCQPQKHGSGDSAEKLAKVKEQAADLCRKRRTCHSNGRGNVSVSSQEGSTATNVPQVTYLSICYFQSHKLLAKMPEWPTGESIHLVNR